MANLNNAATKIRDEFMKLRRDKKITLKEITDKLVEIEIPDWLQSQILQMESYKQYDRITCPIEQAMSAAVHIIILKEITK